MQSSSGAQRDAGGGPRSEAIPCPDAFSLSLLSLLSVPCSKAVQNKVDAILVSASVGGGALCAHPSTIQTPLPALFPRSHVP